MLQYKRELTHFIFRIDLENTITFYNFYQKKIHILVDF